MCGLTGIILGNKDRTEEDFEWIKESLTTLLIRSQARGPNATGIAVIRRDGSYQLLKRPVPANEFVQSEDYQDLMAELDEDVSIIMGHTRYRTIGTEKIPNNNHPIRAGRIIGTHNGTIYNAAQIAEMYGLNRFADVDSEVLFRVANTFRNPAQFKTRLKDFRGQLTAVLLNLDEPETIRIYKGNKPFFMKWLNEMDVLIYASNAAYFESLEWANHTTRDYRIKPNRMIQFDTERKLKMHVSNFKFISVCRQT